MYTQIFHRIKYDLFRVSDLISNLTYILMDNFCPCFHCIISKVISFKKISFDVFYFILIYIFYSDLVWQIQLNFLCVQGIFNLICWLIESILPVLSQIFFYIPKIFWIYVLELWIHKGYFVVWNVFTKSVWQVH